MSFVAFLIDLSKEMLKKCYWHGVGSILCEREESKEHLLRRALTLRVMLFIMCEKQDTKVQTV